MALHSALPIYKVTYQLSGAPKHPLARGKHRVPRDQTFILWRAGEPQIKNEEGVA